MIQVLAQIPDPSSVVETASKYGWEQALVAFTFLSVLAFIFFWLKIDKNQSNVREEKMALRLDQQENKIQEINKTFIDQLVELTKSVTQVQADTVMSRLEVAQALAKLAHTLDEVNGDIKELCQLMKLCPCLLVGRSRGDYRIVDKDGNEIDPTVFLKTIRSEKPIG